MNGRKRALTAAAAAALAWLGATRLAAEDVAFRFFGPLSRVITPNGDGRNDLAFFCFDNPADSGVVGRVYTLLGSEVASIGSKASAVGTSCASGFQPQYVTWDGRSQGAYVRSGLYVYRVEAEGKTHAGTLLVVR